MLTIYIPEELLLKKEDTKKFKKYINAFKNAAKEYEISTVLGKAETACESAEEFALAKADLYYSPRLCGEYYTDRRFSAIVVKEADFKNISMRVADKIRLDREKELSIPVFINEKTDNAELSAIDSVAIIDCVSASKNATEPTDTDSIAALTVKSIADFFKYPKKRPVIGLEKIIADLEHTISELKNLM